MPSERARRAALAAAQIPFLIVVGIVVFAVGFVAVDRWRRGAFVFGSATIVASALRMVLTDTAAGLLAVRSRRFDVAAYLLLGGATLWLAWSIDPLGTG